MQGGPCDPKCKQGEPGLPQAGRALPRLQLHLSSPEHAPFAPSHHLLLAAVSRSAWPQPLLWICQLPGMCKTAY